jgi:hypothetical protein
VAVTDPPDVLTAEAKWRLGCSVCGKMSNLKACNTCALAGERVVYLCGQESCFDTHVQVEKQRQDWRLRSDLRRAEKKKPGTGL